MVKNILLYEIWDGTHLTSKGKVVFKHYDEAKSPELEASFEAWKDIYCIEAYFSNVYGVDKNREVFVIDFS